MRAPRIRPPWALLWLLAVTARGENLGHHNCPCLVGDHSFADNTTVAAIVGGTVYDYPSSYGRGACAAHDAGFEPYCASGNAESFCSLSWCYVNATTCHSSPHVYQASDLFPDSSLYFSYATCGASTWEEASSTWDDIRDMNSLAGKVVRAALHGSNQAPVQYYENIALRAGFTIEWREVSNGSLTLHAPDTTKACVDDVGRGLLDLCIGVVWMKADRMSLSSFTAPICECARARFRSVAPQPNLGDTFACADTDTWYLMLKRPVETTSFLEDMGHPFLPFTWPLWVAILFFTVFLGLVRAQLATSDEHLKEEGADKYGPAGVMKNELYFTFMDLLGGGVDAAAGTDAGHHAGPHLLNIGFAFFVLLVMASYTANLAAMLATESLKSGAITSLEDCAEQKCTLCIFYKIEADFKALYDTTGMNVMPWSSNTPMIQAAIDGSCDATIFDWDNYKSRYGAYDGLCDFYFEGTGLVSMPVAQPCAGDLEKGLSYWIRATTLDGTWDTIINDVRPAPPASCDPFVTAEADMDSGQLGLSNFAMPFIVSAMLTAMAIALDIRRAGCSDFVRRCFLRFGSKTKAREILSKIHHEQSEEDHEPDLQALISDLSAQLISTNKALEAVQGQLAT